MFQPEIATAVACFFLNKATNHRLNDLVLMKLMVISEREVISESTALLTGGAFASMQNGPVLSEVLNLMKGTLVSPLWQSCIEFVPYNEVTKASNHCILKKMPEMEHYFSEFEVQTLEKVWKEFGHIAKWSLVDLTHTFPEWDKSVAKTKTSKPISLETVLKCSLKLDADDAKARADEIKSLEAICA
jgi:uncharacterized phage-associated protein